MVQSQPKAVLITGAARRIGHAIALDLAAHGWAVAIHYRHSGSEAEEAVAEIVRAGGRAVAIRADLEREDEVQALVPRAAGQIGALTCLINNASVFQRDEALDATRESWDRHMEANLRAPFVLTQAFARQLPDDAVGAVINLLDSRVWNLTPHFVSYSVSKVGLWTLTQTLALALAPRIRVNGIGPGPTIANERQSEDHFRRHWESVPLRRRTLPEEICAAVRFILASPALTGQMIALDGGEHLAWAQPKRGITPVE